MPELAAIVLVRALYLELALGLLLLPWWHARGLARLDSAAARAGLGFRLLVSPGLIVLWPLLLARGLRGGGVPLSERNAHRALLEVRS